MGSLFVSRSHWYAVRLLILSSNQLLKSELEEGNELALLASCQKVIQKAPHTLRSNAATDAGCQIRLPYIDYGGEIAHWGGVTGLRRCNDIERGKST